MKQLFGTDGIRGLAGDFPLDQATVFTIGKALARLYADRLGRQPRFVTGRDTRESGVPIESALHAGTLAGGAASESAGVITTPAVAFLTKEFGFDAGIVISASHNPYEDNGIKVFSPDGKKMGDDMERAIEQDIYSAPKNGVHPATQVDTSKAGEFQSAYVDHLAERFADLKLDGLKIVVDCANGAACELAPELFTRLGANVHTINNAPDGRNINADCGSLHLDKLQIAVRERNADLGVAFDGDADRALFVDELGNIVDGDATLWVMSQLLSDNGGLANQTVVATVMSNIGLELALASNGLKLVRTAVGDKYVLDELIRSGSDLGGEQSGHIILPRESLVGDGITTTLFMLRAVATGHKTLSQLTAGFTRYPQILVNVKVREKQPFDQVTPIAVRSREIEGELQGNGRLLLRYSGTENLARVMIEGKDQAAIEKQAHSLAEVIRASLG